MSPIIVWFRQDLRLADNPALHAAAASGRALVPLFIWDAADEWAPGAASRVWLQRSLTALAQDLAAQGSRLILRRGDSRTVLAQIIEQSAAGAVYWNRRYEPAGIAADSVIEKQCAAVCAVESFNARLLFEPFAIATAEGLPYRVFTPFHRACLKLPQPAPPLPPPPRLQVPAAWPSSLAVADLDLVPAVDWAAGIRARWPAGEHAALERLDTFIANTLVDYPTARDEPAREGVSGMSPYLHLGLVSARQIWHAVQAAPGVLQDGGLEGAGSAWLRQLFWREFAYHLLYHFPHTVSAPLRPEFARMDWLDDAAGLRAWQRGRTGFPLVDAGMRELWASGYMHNRVRMVAASFLCKHLGVHWLQGARWFWDTLIDADLANNTLGWQWTAGCGADAAPYFRIFNPLSQSRKFDAAGAYIRRWVPELAHLRAADIHEPRGRVSAYPPPLIDLALARTAALERYARMRA